MIKNVTTTSWHMQKWNWLHVFFIWKLEDGKERKRKEAEMEGRRKRKRWSENEKRKEEKKVSDYICQDPQL